MGYMTSCLDPYSLAFARHGALHTELTAPSLEIGAAFGVASMATLKSSTRPLVACDLSAHHLGVLRQLCPTDMQGRLETVVGRFPSDLHYPQESFSAVLASRVLHFLTIDELEAAAEKIAAWLVPGGHLFVVEDTPYLGNSVDFLKEYEARIAAGVEYPGMKDDTKQVRTTRTECLPDLFHFFDSHVLARTFTRVGLQIINCRMFPRLDYPSDVQLDGREGVGLIARKPKA